MKFSNKPNEEVKTVDGRTFWISRSVAVNLCVIGVLGNEHYILCSKRGPNSADFRGKFNLIAGYLDWNETGWEACKREAWEEVGLDLDNLDSWIIEKHDNSWHCLTEPTENRQNVSLRYGMIIVAKGNSLPELTVENNEVVGETTDPQWLKISEIDKYEWAFNHDKVAKEYYAITLRK